MDLIPPSYRVGAKPPMSTDTPAAAPITAEREACEQSFRASKYMQVVYAPESRQPYLDGWLARAALCAPVAAQPADSAMDALLAVVRAASKVSAMSEDGGDSLVGEAFSLWFAQWQSAWATLRTALAALDALEDGK